MNTTIGFIGFGEAGHAIAKGLASQGLTTRAYDILVNDAAGRATMQARAADAGAQMLDSAAEMVESCDVVLSVVTTGNCFAAADSAAPALRSGQLFADLNSVAPEVKRAAQRVVEASGARYVDAGVMAAVPPHGHRVPILLAGAEAPSLVQRLAPAGMRLDVLSATVGDAAAAKMFASILIKGTEALLLECLVAAARHGVDRRVLESVSVSTGVDWPARADYMLGRVAKHAARRADEMDQVVDTLASMNIEPMVTRGIAQRLHWAAARTNGRSAAGASGYQSVIAALAEPESV